MAKLQTTHKKVIQIDSCSEGRGEKGGGGRREGVKEPKSTAYTCRYMYVHQTCTYFAVYRPEAKLFVYFFPYMVR